MFEQTFKNIADVLWKEAGTSKKAAQDDPEISVRAEPAYSDDDVSEQDIATRLSTIAQLYRDGFLSADEFESVKRKLLHEDPPQRTHLVQDGWYYLRGDDQIGPFSPPEFKSLVFSRQIERNTLVWRTGMAEWTPLHRCNPVQSN